jgi:S1-C subfamily serine protease
VCGALAGTAAGFATSTYSWQEYAMSSPVVISTHATTTPSVVATSTLPDKTLPSLSLVPIEQRAMVSLLPPAFSKRSSSPVISLYKKSTGTAIEDRLLTNDHLLGQGVALTSDGWMVTPASVIAGLKLSEITVWHDGVSATVQRGVLDKLSQTVFLKTNLNGLTSAAFARVQDVRPGAVMWMESDAEIFELHSVTNVAGRSSSLDASSSEFAARRIRFDGPAKVIAGTPVWDPNGSLVGLLEITADGQSAAIPVTSIAASFNNLLMTGEISHAVLGVRTMDLALARIDGDRAGLPLAGAYIRDEKKTGKLGIVKDSPAAKAKLKTGDVIVRVDRDILDGTADLGEVLSEYKPGSTVTLRVLRGTQDLDIPVVLGSAVMSEALK